MIHSTDNKSLRMPLMLLALIISFSAYAQDLTVYRVAGKVESYKNGKAQLVRVSDVLQPTSTVSVPSEGVVELLDEKNAKRFTIRTAGKGTIKQMAESKGNLVVSLTQNYVNYVKNQLRNSNSVVEAQKYTDFATVTREKKEYKPQDNKKKNDPKSMFNDFVNQARKEFNDMRQKANSEYNDFVRRAWDEFTAFSGIPKPEEIKVEPVVYAEEQATDKIHFAKWIKKVFKREESVVVPPLKQEEMPVKTEPIAEVKPVPVPVEKKEFAEMPFTYYGSDMTIHLDETLRFNLGGASREQVADALELLSQNDYNNALVDCFKLREKYGLCDWGYLNMLITIAETFCGPGTNEAVLLAGFLYSQSGYKMRYATDGSHLYMLVGCKQRIYGRNYFVIDNVDYYPVGVEELPSRLNICPAFFDKAICMSLVISPQQNFTFKATDKRTIKNSYNKAVSVDVSVNKNMIDFYYNYPSFASNGDQYTRWLSYANVPLDKPVADQLYPQIRELIKDKTPLQAAELILAWIQHGIPYAFDYEVWGGDRVFFAEETLFYPGSDCEDRAILFTRIVRDVLKLPCVLVYYPGHLASAVHFPDQVRGDRLTLEGTDYVICDPTYIGAPVGMSMPGMEVEKARLILLE